MTNGWTRGGLWTELLFLVVSGQEYVAVTLAVLDKIDYLLRWGRAHCLNRIGSHRHKSSERGQKRKVNSEESKREWPGLSTYVR